jgi:small subunit ribosomal protein S9
MTADKSTRYIEAVGRRKTAIARVRITPAAKSSVTVNGNELANYFKTNSLQVTAMAPLEKSGVDEKFAVSIKLVGGGISAQAGAMSHGLARAIEKFNPTLRGAMKKEGLLTRDQRAKERRKFGLKKARKAPQWSKR